MISKDYCASKNLWYYGLRLHSLAEQSLQNSLPHPIYLQIQTAAQRDLDAMRSVLDNVENAVIALDKAHCDQPLKNDLLSRITPYYLLLKKVKRVNPYGKSKTEKPTEMYSILLLPKSDNLLNLYSVGWIEK